MTDSRNFAYYRFYDVPEFLFYHFWSLTVQPEETGIENSIENWNRKLLSVKSNPL